MSFSSLIAHRLSLSDAQNALIEMAIQIAMATE